MRAAGLSRIAVSTAGLLALGLLAPAHAAGSSPADELVTPPAATTDQRAVVPGQVLVRQRARLTQHAPGWPRSSEPGRRLRQADIDVEVFSSAYSVKAVVDLQDFPIRDEDDAAVSVQFGHGKGQSCSIIAGAAEFEETDSYSRQYRFTGMTSSGDWGGMPAKPWECVAVYVHDLANERVPHDVMVADLVNTYQAPKLKVGTTSVLGKKQKRLKIAKVGWTPVEVAVANTGDLAAGRVTVTGKGKGLKVKADTIDSLRAGGSNSAVIRVRTKGRKKPKRLTLTARAAGGVVAKRTVRVKRVKAPKRPVAGRYRNKSGTVRFQIRKGRIVGFNATTQTRCGGYGSIPQYTQTTYDFPRARIPRNGIVTASAKGKAMGTPWSTQLRMRIAGKKVSRGLFRYHGPGGCSAVEGFTARRVGR